jgi:hypothetical protein
MKTRTAHNNKDKGSSWFLYQGLRIHKKHFKRGLVIAESYNFGVEEDSEPMDAATADAAQAKNITSGSVQENTHLPAKLNKPTYSVDANSFVLGGSKEKPRRLIIQDSVQRAHEAKTALQSKVTQPKANTQAVKKSVKLLSAMADYANAHDVNINVGDEKDTVIFNQERRDEVFLPIDANGTGLYLCPWLSQTKSQPFNFSGFDQYVVALCLFGPSLKGYDHLGYGQPLIKHDIAFHPNQQITTITYTPGVANPYESMVFSELEKQMSFMSSFANADHPKELLVHLPYIDYILFGIELYIHDKITPKALERLLKLILEQKDQYVEKIHDLSSNYQINVTIASPFENLIQNIDRHNVTKSILDALHLPNLHHDKADLADEIQRKRIQQESEKIFVQQCLTLLQENQYNPIHSTVWKDFLSIEHASTRSGKIESIEDLFQVANAIMIGIASHGKADHKICSLLPLTEKQIQVSYQKFSNALRERESIGNDLHLMKALPQDLINFKNSYILIGNKLTYIKHDATMEPVNIEDNVKFSKAFEVIINTSKDETIHLSDKQVKALITSNGGHTPQFTYPAVFNATILDSLVAYDFNTLGRPFYFQECQEALNDLICKKDILKQAHKNVTFFGGREKHSDETMQASEASKPCKLSKLLGSG